MMRQIAALMVLILGSLACSLLPGREGSSPILDTPTASAEIRLEATFTAVVEPSATPPPAPSATPYSPTAAPHPVSTRISQDAPSVAAESLREQPVPPTPPTASGPKVILFVSTRDGTADIYRMNEDGTDQVRMTENGRDNESPTWSADGQQIAFLSHEPGDTSDTAISHLFVMASDGTGSTDLTPELGQSIEELAWSPDGQQIAFVANPTPGGDAFSGTNIYVMKRDGSDLVQITHMDPGSVGCWSPTWSPDGSKLVFICRALMNVGIAIANAGGSDAWSFDQGQVNRIMWLPSGARIGYAGGMCGDVGVINAEFMLTHGDRGAGPWPCLDQDFDALGVGPTHPYGVAWSPLHDTVLAVQTLDNMQIVDLAGYTVLVAQIGSTRLNGPPSWSPDGGRVVFAAEDAGDYEIYVLNREGNELAQLTDNEADDFMPAWQP